MTNEPNKLANALDFLLTRDPASTADKSNVSITPTISQDTTDLSYLAACALTDAAQIPPMVHTTSADVRDVIAASDLLEAQKDIAKRISSARVQLQASTIYCSKTGQPIGSRDSGAAIAAIRIFGKDKYIENAINAHGLGVHPAWVLANGDALDTLMDEDVRGYIAYCLGVICDKYTNKPAKYDRSHFVAHYWSLARAFAILGNFSNNKALLDLKYKLCELLTYGPDPIRYIVMRLGDKAKMPDALAALAITGELEPMLARAIDNANAQFGSFDYALQRNRFEDAPATPADNARGPSNIRQQRRSKNRVRVDMMAQQFTDMGLGFIMTPEERERAKAFNASRSKSGDWRSTIAKQAEKPLACGLDVLAQMDFSKVQAAPSDEPEDDDDTVTVRTISREEADWHTRKDAPAPVVPDTAPVVELLATLEQQPEPKATGVNPALLALVAKQAEPAKAPEPPAKVVKGAALLAMLRKG